MNIVVLSGAGISAESGIKTFRDSNGLWEGHDVMEVASPQGWDKNPAIVLDFYNQRRKQLLSVSPNKAHFDLAALEQFCPVSIITQNVDDLHERAGSKNVIHLHGELRKVRSTVNPNEVYSWDNDLTEYDKCKQGYPLRPHIVWFGEEVPKIEEAVPLVNKATHIIVVGTSMQVYPAAGLIEYRDPDCKLYVVDPNPTISETKLIKVIPEKASTGIEKAIADIKNGL